MYMDELILMSAVPAALIFARTGYRDFEARLCIGGGDARTSSADTALLYKLKARRTRDGRRGERDRRRYREE